MLVSQMPMTQLTPPTQDADATTNWHILATDGTGYATLALLQAAGRTPYPGLPGGSMVLAMNFTSLATGGAAAGSLFYYAYNTLVSPATSGLNGKSVFGGVNLTNPGMIYNIWIQKTVSTDLVEVTCFG